MKKQLLILLGILLFAVPCEAATSKIYVSPEASITWTDSGGDEVLDLGGLVADGVVIGAFSDLGSASHAFSFNIEVTIDGFTAATPPAIGDTVDVYLTFSNTTTNFDGNPTTDPQTGTAGTMTTAQLDNAMFIGSLVVYSTDDEDELKATFQNVQITSRYVSVVIHNNTADTLEDTGDAHTVILIPSPYEAQ